MSATAPTITGTQSGQITMSETPVYPFSGVTIGDGNAGATDTLSITLSGGGSLAPSNGWLSYRNGSYFLTGTAADITSDLETLVFTPSAPVPGAFRDDDVHAVRRQQRRSVVASGRQFDDGDGFRFGHNDGRVVR